MCVVLADANFCSTKTSDSPSLWERETLTDGFGELADELADQGIEVSTNVTEVWHEQALYDETLRLRLGKLDITGGFECRACAVSFDGSAFANDETAQFLTGSLVNNLTIPFPDKGLGAYRIGVWNDPRAKGYTSAPKETKNGMGFYLSCDQMLLKESANEDASQGLGGFFRYGSASGERNDVQSFWSAGLQYQDALFGRDDDVLALGTSQAIFSDLASGTYSADNETVIETYYSAQVTPSLTISPNQQHVRHPGGDQSIAGTYIAGVRAQMAF